MKGRKQAVEIPKKSFGGYSAERKLLGIIPYIILYEKRQGKMAKYPTISLSALTRRERERIFKSLDGITPVK
ncbi:MAG: hypothetical protein IH591_10385 [Bacteroidales bacterium]|nr:hypothetical protein [Bacteroidales bacterium]